MGLRRSLRSAGAAATIISLWRIDDVATRDLMVMLYEGMWKENLEPYEALRRAQLEMLRRSREEYGRPRPHTWGAFVFEGVPRDTGE